MTNPETQPEDWTAPLDFVTVVTSVDGRLMTKKITPAGVAPWQNTFKIRSERRFVDNLADLVAVLDSIGPDSCIIHGQILPGIDPQQPHQRTKHEQTEKNVNIDGEPVERVIPPSYGDASHHWLLLDIDGPEADGFDWLYGLGFGELPIEVTALLPPELHGVQCHWRLTSSAAIKPGVRIRLAYWLDRSLSSDEKEAWLGRHKPIIDPSLFRTVQPNYVADPIFEGVSDPTEKFGVTERTGMVTGFRPVVAVPEITVVEREPVETSADLTEDDRDPYLVAEAKALLGRINWAGATPLGNRTEDVIHLLADMSTTEGKIFSNAGIVAVIEENCPPAAQAKPGEIAEMAGRLLDPNVRINPRGCRSIGWPPTYIPPQETDAAADLQEDLILYTGTPWRSAHKFIARRYSGSRRLIHYRGEFCVWNGTHYEQISGRALKAELYPFLDMAKTEKVTGTGDEKTTELVPFSPTAVKVSEVFKALEAAIHVEDKLEAPAWHPKALRNGPAPNPREFIAFANGLLHLPTTTLQPHSPELINFTCLPFNYDPAAPQPNKWHGFMQSVWSDDQEAIDTLQEIFGYLLSGATRQQKMFLIVGKPRSGKGTIARVLQEMLGSVNVTSPTLGSLSGEFGLQPLINKSLAIISDLRPSNNSNVVVERLLAISGEDSSSVNRKGVTAWEGRLGVRFLMLSNEVPNFRDASMAITNRLITLKMNRSFLGREKLGLTEELLGDLPGILNWSLAGLDRLNKRGYFVTPASSSALTRDMEALASPITEFVNSTCVLGGEVARGELYDAWCIWCRDNGHQPQSNAVFGRNLRTAVDGLVDIEPRINGKQVRSYKGISLRDGYQPYPLI